MKHAKLSASASARWLNCPASVKLSEGIPNKPSSFYAQEGSVAHELGEMCLNSGKPATDYIGVVIELDGGFRMGVTEDMADYVQQYVDYVEALLDTDAELMVEQRVEFTNWVPGGFGTSDAIVIDRANKIIHVVDLKYGMGERVYAEGNTQAQLYALGVIQLLDEVDLDYNVFIHIHQPRIYHVDTWETSVHSLMQFGVHANKQATIALSDNAPFGPSDKSCRWCPVAGTCTALAQKSLEVISAEFDDLDSFVQAPTPTLRDPSLMTLEQVAQVMPMLPLIEKWCKVIAENALEEIQQGKVIPGYKVVAGRSTRGWTAQGETEICTLLGAEALTKPKLVSPAQAEKVLKKDKIKLDEEWVDKKEGKPTLAKVTDKRPALSITADDFESI